VTTAAVWYLILILLVLKTNTADEVLLQAPSIDNIYPICLPAESPLVPANLTFSSLGEHWDCCLGHCGAHTIAILKKNRILDISTAFYDNYTTNCLAKSHKLPCNLVEHRTYFPLEGIHSDV